jgi:D-arabinose 5-phosphate isomerase GutQ
MTNTSQVDLLTRAKAVVEGEAQAVEALVDQFDASLERLVDLILNCKGHVLVTGAGTSRAVAERFAHLLACCGTPGLFVSAADSLHGGAGAITANDVVFIISKGGHSAEINQFAELAKARGATVIAQTETPESPLAQISDAVYKVKAIGDIDPYGMIATGSSLVNAAACDVLCVLLLERKGYTKEEFGVTHPGGAVGKKLAEEHK